jgi:hypothetical protein
MASKNFKFLPQQYIDITMPALLQDAFRGVSPAVLSTWPGGVGALNVPIPLRGGGAMEEESWGNNDVTMKVAEIAKKTYVPPKVGGARKQRRRPTRKAQRKAQRKSRRVQRKSRRLTRRK